MGEFFDDGWEEVSLVSIYECSGHNISPFEVGVSLVSKVICNLLGEISSVVGRLDNMFDFGVFDIK